MTGKALTHQLAPLLTLAAFLAAWHVAVTSNPKCLIPGPLPALRGVFELAQKGLLLKYTVASLFRVTWGYMLAILLGIPLGLLMGWYRRLGCALAPLVQLLRPISALAWIPFAILWFGLGDVSAVFLIFIASFLPLVMAAMQGVRNIEPIYLQAARNFGLTDLEAIVRVALPAVMPHLVVGLRMSLGIAWLVVVAAEMIAVNSGLGFLIVDARNAGNRYDLVLAGMALIGLIGLFLDFALRRLEQIPSLRWAYGESD